MYIKEQFYREFKDLNDCVTTIKALENGIPLEQIRDEIEHMETLVTKFEVLQVIDNYMK